MSVVWADIVIIVVIVISALISWLRGLIKEVLSLLAWVLAFWVGATFTHGFAELLVNQIAADSIRLMAAFLILFLGTLVIAGVVNFLIGKLIAKTGLSSTDRALGVLFGIARGTAIIFVLVLLAGLTTAPELPWWEQSLILPQFEPLAVWVTGLFPESLAKYFAY